MQCYRCKKEKEIIEFNGKKSCNDCRKAIANYQIGWKDNLSLEIVNECEKRCNRCKVIKSKSCFNDGQEKCIDCETYCKNYYKQNQNKEIERATKSQKSRGRDKINAQKRNLCRTNPVNYMLQNARQRAKKLGLPFDLTRDDIVIPAKCPVLGYELKISDGKQSPNSPSIDRIIPSYGYVKGNIRIISCRANDIRGNATLDELKKVVKYIETSSANSI
jgi:hypothetical protein